MSFSTRVKALRHDSGIKHNPKKLWHGTVFRFLKKLSSFLVLKKNTNDLSIESHLFSLFKSVLVVIKIILRKKSKKIVLSK